MSFLSERIGKYGSNLILCSIQLMINEKSVAFRHQEIYVLDFIKFNLL